MDTCPPTLPTAQDLRKLTKLCVHIIGRATPFMTGARQTGYKIPVRDVDRIRAILQRNGLLGD
jgi:hypothetical protein